MQLSAANLLIAAQQAKTAQPARAAAAPAFSLDGEEGFAPIAFKQKEAPAAAPQAAPSAGAKIGANLDIRV